MLEIASRLGPPRSNVQAMRSTCKVWRAGVPITNGPLLLMSCLDDPAAQFKTLALSLQMIPAQGGATTSLVPCPFFSRTSLATPSLLPHHASVWGGANGLVALQKEDTFGVHLFCMNCGQDPIHLARLPFGYSTGSRLHIAPEDGVPNGGVFCQNLPNSRFAILFSNNPTMFTDQHVDAFGYRQWAFYPGTEDVPMCSVGFLGASHVVAVSSHLKVVIGPVEVTFPGPGNWFFGPAISEPLVTLDIPVEAEGPPAKVPWGRYGNHIFTCADRVYVCVLLRAVSDEDDVSCAVYYLDRLPDGNFALVRTYNIGNFAVYLGANQALVLPGTESEKQLANTIYVPDDDGVETTARILLINIASGDAVSILFPHGVNPVHYGRATWVAPPPLNVPFWHCDTTMAR